MQGLILVFGTFIVIAVFVYGSQDIGDAVANLSKTGRLILATAVIAVAGLAYAYVSGIGPHLLWRYMLPPQPPGETEFVASVEASLDTWPSADDRSACERKSGEFTGKAANVVDWSGTIVTKYMVGTGIALVVQIGRQTRLTTGYVRSSNSVLIDANSPTAKAIADLQPGDAVVFSGSAVGDWCALPLDGSSGPEFLFRFDSVRSG